MINMKIIKHIQLKNNYNVINSKTRTFQELSADRDTLINFEEGRENFVSINL